MAAAAALRTFRRLRRGVWRQRYACEWNIPAFTNQNVEMAIATDRKTGHRMRVIRMKSGEVMAIVPATPLWALMKDKALGDDPGP